MASYEVCRPVYGRGLAIGLSLGPQVALAGDVAVVVVAVDVIVARFGARRTATAICSSHDYGFN